jgi:hypothetical protein
MRQKEYVNPAIYWLSFAIQQVMVPVVIWAITTMIQLLVPIIENRFYGWNDVLKGASFVLPAFVGFGLGFGATYLPWAIKEPARHIWVLPLLIFLGLYGYSFVTDIRYLMAMLPIDTSSMSDEYSIVLLMFPCAACCLYSIAVRAGDRAVKIDHAAVR